MHSLRRDGALIRAADSMRYAPIVTRTAELPAYRIEFHGPECACCASAAEADDADLSAQAKGVLAITAVVVVTTIMFAIDPRATIAALAAPFGVGL